MDKARFVDLKAFGRNRSASDHKQKEGAWKEKGTRRWRHMAALRPKRPEASERIKAVDTSL